jgi:hypothetical protein
MLLRRIAQHVKNENWFAVFIDFIIVVVGVFIGIQVANWNEERADKLDEQETLIALKSDVLETKTNIEEYLKSVGKGQNHLRQLAEFSDGQHDDMPITQIDENILNGLYAVYYTTTNMLTYLELINTGRIDIISDSEIRRHLKILSDQIADLENEEASIEKMSYETIDPFLLENVEYRGFVSIPSASIEKIKIDWLDPNKGRDDPKIKLRNTKFQNLVLYKARLNLTQLTIAKQSLVTLEIIVAQIDKTLEKQE